MRKHQDLVGQKFGKLTVIKEHSRNRKNLILWECLCECGQLTLATSDHIKCGHKRSCGCLKTGPKSEDLIGQTFARLLVIEYAFTDKWRSTHWKCRCRCGKETTVSRNSLLHGLTKSCGCLVSEQGKIKLQTWRKNQTLLTDEEKKYKRQLYRMLRIYGLTEEDYLKLVKEQNGECAICHKQDRLVIDHCHKTNLIRKLLCFKCNVLLGNALDNIEILKNAITYLEKYNVDSGSKNYENRSPST